ncbi:MAG: phosphoribosylformylglycinamidine synthase subunit PurL [Thermoplasmata archaeon]|nr:phosphoribosylformylglycinamidine synthase subunit PurL [Thermoplasmata archaeon]
MGTRATPTPEPWAEGVVELPVRSSTAKQLEATSAERGLGFSSSELARIQAYYRSEHREPTDVELAGLAQSWSEHCSYKSSRRFLRSGFARLHARPKVLGTGDAGVLRFEDGYAYAIRIESHNHPSAVEPYGGAATGIGGILRDVLAVGGKPIALADPLFFGPLDAAPEAIPPGVKSPRYLMSGVVAGIRDYGNRVGVPTVSGGVYFDPAYTVNPLVNVGCVGFLPTSRLQPNRADRAGDRLVLVGGLTGRDGIGGVAFASQELTERSEEESRGAVQLGNPIMKEPLIRACLEAFDRRLVRGVKDLGGGGLASASGELVHSGGFGLRIDLDRVPVREEGLRPWEIWISESQERMILDVRPRDLAPLLAIFRRYDVPATDVGEVIKEDRERLFYRGSPAGHLRLSFRIDPPILRRPTRRRTRPERSPTLRVQAPSISALFEEMVLAPDSLSREPIIRVYDHEVQGRTVVKSLHGKVTSPSHGDAAILRPRTESWAALAVTVAAQPWACREDPGRGAALVVEEAARNLYAVGATPDAFTNCLNFGNPEDPRVLGDFADVVRGLASAARALRMAVPGGNVSFYNGGLGAEIPPTPVLMATGLLPDLRTAVTSDLKDPGNPLYLVGTSRQELGGSLYARRRGIRGLPVPPPAPERLRRAGGALVRAGTRGLLRSVHDLSDGGLAVTLAEMAFGGHLGFSVDLAATGLPDAGIGLVAEGGSRWVAEVPAEESAAFERGMRGIPIARLGRVTDAEGVLLWKGGEVGRVPLDPLYGRWRPGIGIP